LGGEENRVRATLEWNGAKETDGDIPVTPEAGHKCCRIGAAAAGTETKEAVGDLVPL
jgi:hypothetical protein